LGALALGYVYYYAYLRPRRADRWTMPDAPFDEHDARDEEPGGVLMGPVLELNPPGVPEQPS